MNSNICVDNIKNDEIIPYRIILLRGHVQHSLDEEKICISLNNDPEEVCAIKNNTFRAIFHLDDGDNTFTIRFNDCSKNLSVRFERPIAHLPYTVQPVYIICEGHDGRFQAPADVDNSIESAAARILTGAKLIQSVLGELFHVSSFGRKTFYLLESVEIFHSALKWTKALDMSETELWEYFGREIMTCSKIGQPSKKYLAFLSHTKYCSEKYHRDSVSSCSDLIKITDGYVALGGGGLALFGSASLFTWPFDFTEIMPCFTNDKPIDRQLLLDHSLGSISTMSSSFSTTLGAVIHELLHCFDLAHNSVGIMGTDYYKIKELFSNDEKSSSTTPLTSLGVIKKSSGSNGVIQIDVSNISLTESSIMILAYNKWLNCSSETNEPYTLSFDARNNFVKSSLGIRAIELRTLQDSYVLKSWIFPKKVLKYSHLINLDEIKLKKITAMILFVIDNKGNILKDNIHVKS